MKGWKYYWVIKRIKDTQRWSWNSLCISVFGIFYFFFGQYSTSGSFISPGQSIRSVCGSNVIMSLWWRAKMKERNWENLEVISTKQNHIRGAHWPNKTNIAGHWSCPKKLKSYASSFLSSALVTGGITYFYRIVESHYWFQGKTRSRCLFASQTPPGSSCKVYRNLSNTSTIQYRKSAACVLFLCWPVCGSPPVTVCL